MRTQSTSLSVGFHGEAGRISHNASFQPGPIRADLRRLGVAHFNEEGASENVVSAIRHIHHVLASLLRLIRAGIGRSIEL